MNKLFIICGHGDGDPGACGNGYKEAERVRALAKRIKYYGGAAVVIGDTSKNWYKDKLVNNKNIPNGYLVLELHMDCAVKTAKGAHVVIDADLSPDKYDKALAKFISNVFPGRSKTIVKRNNLANLNRAEVAGINYRLLECGFISNTGDIKIFNSRMDYIAKGILKSFGIEPKKKEFQPYKVKITCKTLNVRKNAGTKNKLVGVITSNENLIKKNPNYYFEKTTYTIVEEKKIGKNRWGKLKSSTAKNPRWIHLGYTKKVK